jgi:hypothetical protein
MNINNIIHPTTPVAIGGVGGSGTRLVAEIVKQLGYFIGDDLNHANDNLLFTLLFKDVALWNCSENLFSARYALFKGIISRGIVPDESQKKLLHSCVNERDQHNKSWLLDRVNAAITDSHSTKKHLWGWKEPNTHIFIPQILKYNPEIKYIHVMRNGLDMAYSKNQNQLKLWGEKLLGYKPSITPSESLKYWIEVHKRILHLQQQHPENIIIINYDELSCGSQSEMNKIIQFIGISIEQEKLSLLQELCIPQNSTARYKDFNNDFVTQEQYRFLENLGFSML